MMYKQLVEQERARTAELEKRIRSLQDQYDNTQISATVKDVPGVDPATLLEEFSGAFVRLKRECSRLKAANALSQSGAPNRRPSSQLEDSGGDDDSWNDAMGRQDDPTSEPGTIRELLFSLPLPQSSHDYEKILEALGSGMLGQQVMLMLLLWAGFYQPNVSKGMGDGAAVTTLREEAGGANTTVFNERNRSTSGTRSTSPRAP